MVPVLLCGVYLKNRRVDDWVYSTTLQKNIAPGVYSLTYSKSKGLPIGLQAIDVDATEPRSQNKWPRFDNLFWCFPNGQRCHRWQSDSCEERTSAGMMVGDGTLKGPVTWWNLSFWECFLARRTTELYPEAERLRPNLEWLQMTYPNSLQVNELCFCGAVVDSLLQSPRKTPRSRAKSREDKEVQACTWKVSLSSHSHWRSQGVTDGSASMSIIPQKIKRRRAHCPPRKSTGCSCKQCTILNHQSRCIAPGFSAVFLVISRT